VSRGGWHNKVKVRRATEPSLDLRALVQSLVQASQADLSLLIVDRVLEQIEELDASLADVPDEKIVNGKDCMAILTRQLAALEVKIDDAARLLWPSFQRDQIHRYPELSAVVQYLHGG
jgi:hypothetical protein